MTPHHDTVLWTLRGDGGEASAVLRYIEDYGYDVRLIVDGSLRRSRMFTKGHEALDWANEARADLETRGWSSPVGTRGSGL